MQELDEFYDNHEDLKEFNQDLPGRFALKKKYLTQIEKSKVESDLKNEEVMMNQMKGMIQTFANTEDFTLLSPTLDIVRVLTQTEKEMK